MKIKITDSEGKQFLAKRSVAKDAVISKKVKDTDEVVAETVEEATAPTEELTSLTAEEVTQLKALLEVMPELLKLVKVDEAVDEAKEEEAENLVVLPEEDVVTIEEKPDVEDSCSKRTTDSRKSFGSIETKTSVNDAVTEVEIEKENAWKNYYKS